MTEENIETRGHESKSVHDEFASYVSDERGRTCAVFLGFMIILKRPILPI